MSPLKTPAIIVDLDGTLADISVRQRFLHGKKKDWKSFNASIRTDTLHEWCREIINHMKPSYKIILLSGRTDALKEETKDWLRRHEVHWDLLFMRDVNDFRPDQIMKLEVYQQQIEPFYDVLFVIDDRSKVVTMWRSQGLICLQCAEGEF